ncbi:B-cell receptor CD22-like isoform X2 [Silurus meridionalis]|uniref:B-cell receptor CD22-like isoform X2 n=1 Tax=Silurus meridionalis TaxID=175797 RepID=UPI001EEB9487|nr:B-cell receptor CD22-like isoform X2 [Silurus meridionalis]
MELSQLFAVLLLISIIPVAQAQGSPKAVLTIIPDSQVINGERVVLKCEVQGIRGGQWTYSWYKYNNRLSEEEDGDYTFRQIMGIIIIRFVSESDSGDYTCRGQRRDSLVSEISDAVTLTVSVSKPTVRVSPQRFVYTGDTITLSCKLQETPAWGVFWYKNDQDFQLHNTKNTKTFNVTVDTEGETMYQCRAHRRNTQFNTDHSDPVEIIVRERPKPMVSINPDKHVYNGDNVTLRCEIQDESVSRWQYSWYKDASLSPVSSEQMYRISGVELTHIGNYTCIGRESGGSRSSHLSDAVTLTVSERPKPVSSINPDKQVFSGDTVTLRCEIQDESVSRWQYSWYKDASLSPVSSVQMYSISGVEVTHTGKYTCKGRESGGSRSSHLSDAVTLTVSERPKAVLSVSPQNWLNDGDSVTLSCEVTDSSTDWTFSWYREVPYKDGVTAIKNTNGYIMYVELLSDSSRGSGGNYTLSPSALHHTGVYVCRGERGEPAFYTQYSNPQLLRITERLKPVASINPDKQVFSGDTVTLRCEIQDESVSRWQYSWYKDASLSPVSSVQMYTISSVEVTHIGNYTCIGQEYEGSRSSQLSDAVTLTVSVRPKPVASINPDKQVFSGDTVTLRCEIQDESVSRWQYSWYKDASLSPVSSVQMYTISSVEVTHTGKYTCKGRESGGSRSSHLSDAVTLTVSERPQAVLSVSPQNWLTEGDSVTLSCEVTDSSTDWTFSWYREVPYKDSNSYALYKLILLSDSSRGSGGSYTLSPSALNHSGVYLCRGERGEPAIYTHYSNTQPLWISGESPPVSVILTPRKTQRFTDDSLSLSCEDQSNSTGWAVRRYTDSKKVLDCSQWGSVSNSTCNISFLSPTDNGVYWCESESGENSNPVNITVHDSGSRSRHRHVGMAAIFGFLLIALLIPMIWLLSYKRDKEMQQKYKQTSKQNQSRSGAEDFQSGLAPLQAVTKAVNLHCSVEKEHKYAPVDQTDLNGTDKASLEDITTSL